MPSNESLDGPATNGNKPIHSLDLPQLYKRPSFLELLQVLELLKLPPPSWDSKSRRSQENEDVEGVSEEEWEQRCETIHGIASKRLAERCGRSAMPEIIRTWVIPTSGSLTDITIELCEPPLTGDSLGLKTWGTSFVMAKMLEELGNQYFGHILSNSGSRKGVVTAQSGPTLESELAVRIELTMETDSAMKNNSITSQNETIGGDMIAVSGLAVESDVMHQGPVANSVPHEGRILELGSGTGLLGLTAAMLWNKSTILTDLPDIVPNLEVNLKRNGFDQTSDTIASAAVLDWSNAEDSVVFNQNPNNKFEIVLVADPLYDSHQPSLLAGVITKFLKHNEESRVLVSVPLRDNATKALKNDFEGLMSTQGYQLVASGMERCFDDWEESEQDESDGVYCWWGIWKHDVVSSTPPYR
ncbi:Protein-lysine N-methyltransferase rrg1 [Ciborinia camelliae]|nr:Protein-lysine N-methyltransferase rrg1 [Ciborinia camelliae]